MLLRMVVTVGVLGALFVSSAASAQAASDDELARNFFETGRTQFNRAEYAEAARSFASAYRLSGRPALLLNQSRALEAAGDIAAAVDTLHRAQRELPADSELRPEVEARLTRLEAQLSRQQEQEGSEEQEESASASEGDEASPPPPAETGMSPLFWGGVATAGVGAASLVVALVTGVVAHGIYGNLQQNCPGDVCTPDHAGDIDRGRTLAVASTATLIIGAIAAAAGASLIVVDAVQGDPESPAVALDVGPGAVRVHGRF